MELRLGLFVKHSAFDGMLGPVLRKFGAIPIDRRAPGGLVGQTVDAFRDRSELLIGLAPQPIKEYRIALTQSQRNAVSWILLAGMPGSVLLMGTLVWLRRRK